jgi:Tfp pilus assembly protein FimT
MQRESKRTHAARGRRRSLRPPRIEGFSVLELVFVLTLVAVAAGITIPLTQSTVAAYRLETASVLLANKVAQARAEALRRNRSTWLLIDVQARSSQIQTTNQAGATVDLGQPQVLPPDVDFTGAPGPTVTLQFDPMGRLALGPLTVRVRSQALQAQRVLTIQVTGRVTIT